MWIRDLHPWHVSPKEAIEIQKRLREELDLRRIEGVIKTVAGVDVSSSRRSHEVWAGAVVFSYPELVKVEEKGIRGQTDFPYVPGLLGFREIPLILRALALLEIEPDLILCDGQGIAHPRHLGLASHLGLVVDKPTIGCAKSRLVGEFSTVPERKGGYSHLSYEGAVVGAVARTRTGVKPLFVSPGNRITLDESLAVVFNCSGRYRVPEPTRLAHHLVCRLRRAEET